MGGLFRAPKAPAAPDPVATAQAQGQMNADTARTNFALNAYDQITPYGNTTWHSDGPDRWRVVQTLSPAEQRQLDLSNQAQELYGQAGVSQLQRLQGIMSSPFDPNLPALTGRVDTGRFGQADISADAVERAMLERMRPEQERAREGLESRLAAQGIGLGTAAWRAAMDDYNRGVNDSRLGAILARGQEQSRIYGLGLQDAQFGNNARGQELAIQQAIRNQPLNEVAALLTGQQVQSPGQIAGPQVQMQPGDYQGAVAQNYAGQMAGYNSQMAQRNATIGALAGLGGAALGGWASRGFGFGQPR